MKPRDLLAVLLLALGAACGAGIGQTLAASNGGSISAPLPADALPVPPTKPRHIQSLQQFAPAPVPDVDMPRPRADVKADEPHTKVVPNLFKEPERRTGDGYVSGSGGTYDGDHRSRPSPGINVLVPVQ